MNIFAFCVRKVQGLFNYTKIDVEWSNLLSQEEQMSDEKQLSIKCTLKIRVSWNDLIIPDVPVV